MAALSHDPHTLPVLEEATLGRLLALRLLAHPGEPDVLQELLRIFSQDARERVEALRRAHDAADRDGVKRAAHALKGSTANMGALRTSARAQAFEAAPERANAADISALAGDLDDAIAQLTRRFHD